MKDQPAMAMCWYDEEQWGILKAREPEVLDDTYEEWRRNATSALHELRQAGHNIRKITIKIDQFDRWCAENSVRPDAEARAAYVTWKLSQRD